GVHAVLGIPESLEFAEGLHDFSAEHFGEQGAARLAVAMFTGERAAEGDDDVCGAIDELAEFADTGRGFEVEVDAHVDTALAEVAVEGAAVAVFAHEGVDLAQVDAELRGRNG